MASKQERQAPPSTSAKDRAKNKNLAINRTFERLNETVWKPKGVNGVFINTDVLMLATMSYALDIERLNTFHGITVADEPKQACYLMKWLIKTKPVQFMPQGRNGRQDHLILNETLALFFALNLLKVRPSLFSEKYIELLIYTLKFRRFEEDSWLPLLSMLWSMTRMQVRLPEKI